MAEILSVHVTAPTLEEARRLARLAVESGHAACANLLPGESVYRWEGRLVEEPEVVLILKTTRAAWPALRDSLLRAHSYELPCIVALPVAEAHAPYAAWVAANSKP